MPPSMPVPADARPPMPRVLGPKGLQLPDTCQNCKFWVLRADDPQGITRCSAEPPKLFTVQVPQVLRKTEKRGVGMQTQVTSDFPPAPPWWSCGKFQKKLVLAR